MEPDKEACTLYKRNMIDNGFKNYHILNYALSYDLEKKYLAEDFRSAGGGILTSQKDLKNIFDYGHGYRTLYDGDIETITVEEIIKRFNLKSIDLAKWDIEGSELECFEKMSDETAAKFKYMVGEFHIFNFKEGDFKASQQAKSEFWEAAKDKFPHLEFNHYAELATINRNEGTYARQGIGIFEAVPVGQGTKQQRVDFLY